jgi:hypothetical protein
MKKMDDQRFDDIIKQKVGEYEDTGFDPSALSALHHQMAGASTWPWYSRYAKELLITSGMALCTLIIVGSQWYFSQTENNLLKQNVAEVTAQQEQIKDLVREITVLKNLPPDTVRITELKAGPSFSSSSIVLVQRIEHLEGALRKMQLDLQAYQSHSNETLSNYAYAQESSSSPTRESEQGYSDFNTKRVQAKSKERSSAHAIIKNAETFKSNEKELSAETLRALEKHYQRGIGIRVGPTFELSRGLYNGGTSKIDYTGGAIADLILSPSISIETGAKFSHRFYETSEEDLISQLPNVDNTLGPLLNAEVDSWMLEVPINLKYHYPISRKTSWVGGLGYTSQIYTRQIFEYEHGVDANPAARLTVSTKINKVKMYPGTLNISLGLDHRLKKNNLETTFFYQHGLGETGAEKIKANFFGIRGTYWFTLR